MDGEYKFHFGSTDFDANLPYRALLQMTTPKGIFSAGFPLARFAGTA
jgi:hypothetical protein